MSGKNDDIWSDVRQKNGKLAAHLGDGQVLAEAASLASAIAIRLIGAEEEYAAGLVATYEGLEKALRQAHGLFEQGKQGLP